jgi:hypothetical protein
LEIPLERKHHRALDTELQRQRYGENTEAQRALGYFTDVMNIKYMGRLLGTESTWKYMVENDLEDLRDFDSDYDLYEWVTTTQLDCRLLYNGQILEFGTATGRTLNQFAYWLPYHTIVGFDSWQGLPEPFNDLPSGHFAQALPKVLSNTKLVQGWFGKRPQEDQSTVNEYTAEKFARENTAPLALLHLDADLYSSTKTVLTAFANHIQSGTIILFNEYWNHPTWSKHEYRAWQEHVKTYNIRYEYIGYVSNHQEVAIKVL